MEPITTINELIQLCKTLGPIFEKAQRLFSGTEDLPEGIVDRTKLLAKHRLPGEVFAAELLTEPVRIEPHNDRMRIVIDRRNIKKAVITSNGKRKLCENFINPRVKELVRLDENIHVFFRDYLSKKQRPLKPLVLPPMPFRWASGGIISLVGVFNEDNDEYQYYVPMFFRDIQPAGWNISLGSSERLINRNGTVLSDFDAELNSPSLFILREFLEETLILDRHPSFSKPKRFWFNMPYELSEAQKRVAEQLQDDHRDLRRDYDNIEIRDDDDFEINPILPRLSMDLKILSDKPKPEGLSNVLVTINCLELGIEVVKVIKYDIPKERAPYFKEGMPYFLDGEILAKNLSEPELVRMPIALFPLKLLRELFSGPIALKYNGGVQSSIEVSRSLTTGDLELFTWDIERRNDIINGKDRSVGDEVSRYNKWKSEFGDFADGQVSRLFTPATVKILNMLFSADIV